MEARHLFNFYHFQLHIICKFISINKTKKNTTPTSYSIYINDFGEEVLI